jgi:hypothetical protein
MKALIDFMCVLLRGKVIVSRSQAFEFKYDRMLGFGWNYYVFHCGAFTIWASDPQVGAAKQ